MRKLVALELVSLDGVMEAPEAWAFAYSDEEMEQANAAGMAAFWPNQPAGTPMVDYITSVRKYVVSRTLEEPLGCNNSTLIKGDVMEGIAELKRQPGKDITIIGSGELVEEPLPEQRPDELRLMVHPLILGRGKRLFEDGDHKPLEFVDSRVFGSGVISLAYRPANEQGEGDEMKDLTRRMQ